MGSDERLVAGGGIEIIAGKILKGGRSFTQRLLEGIGYNF
jgi:hypothetical protein